MGQDRRPARREPPGHGSSNRGRRWLLPVGGAVVLLALVAMGSLHGPLGSGRGRPRYPADLVDSLLLLLLLAMVAAGVLAIVSLWPDRHLVGDRRRRASGFGLILPMAAVVALWLLRDVLGLGSRQDDPPTATPAPPSTLEVPTSPDQPGVVPLVVAGLALAAMVAIAVAQLLAERRRRRPPRTPAERLVELVDDTLEDLEAEPDPRRAVIAAWARMERGLAAAGLPRHPAEAPFEYAARVLEAALARPASVHRLTGLFERAKFSHHPIGRADRDQAIAALRTVRRELAEAAEAAAQAEASGVGR
ncbi:MAG TPA: DUF4129 domain-containing protein [Actinomycetes bacterium]|nr:DUF4129 domain-containing protein [Actinomycetes bacterium]